MKLAHLRIDNPIVQAPMAGVTDAPFRTISRRFHDGLIFTEMISAEALCRNNARTMVFAKMENGHHPIAFQIVGSKVERMVIAARMAEKMGADILDINAACPEKNVMRGGAGGALLKDPDKLADMVGQISSSINIPVSVKLRLGYYRNDSLLLARKLEGIGASFLTFHGRTVAQKFSGDSDRDALRTLVEEVDIPILANGGGLTEQKAVDLLHHTGAEGVMLGRGIRGRPDLVGTSFSLLKTGQYERMSKDLLLNTIMDHARLENEYYGVDPGIKRMRKHVVWYMKAAGHPISHKEVYQLRTLDELGALLAIALDL